MREKNQAMVNGRRALQQKSSIFQYCSWHVHKRMWRVQFTFGGVNHDVGYFHDEDEAGRFADGIVLRLGGVPEEMRNFGLDGKPTGYGLVRTARQTSGLAARADAVRKGKFIGVKEIIKDGVSYGFRARIWMAKCIQSRTPCPAAFGVVKCKCGHASAYFGRLDTGASFKTAEDAARRYNQVVITYGLNQRPYFLKLNPVN
jgi:hypothetical protein